MVTNNEEGYTRNYGTNTKSTIISKKILIIIEIRKFLIEWLRAQISRAGAIFELFYYWKLLFLTVVF